MVRSGCQDESIKKDGTRRRWRVVSGATRGSAVSEGGDEGVIGATNSSAVHASQWAVTPSTPPLRHWPTPSFWATSDRLSHLQHTFGVEGSSSDDRSASRLWPPRQVGLQRQSTTIITISRAHSITANSSCRRATSRMQPSSQDGGTCTRIEEVVCVCVCVCVWGGG